MKPKGLNKARFGRRGTHKRSSYAGWSWTSRWARSSKVLNEAWVIFRAGLSRVVSSA